MTSYAESDKAVLGCCLVALRAHNHRAEIKISFIAFRAAFNRLFWYGRRKNDILLVTVFDVYLREIQQKNDRFLFVIPSREHKKLTTQQRRNSM